MLEVQTIFEKSQLHAGMHVADFGCGRNGHIVFPASKIVGDRGVVYAVDILKDDLHDLEKRVKDLSLINVHFVWADMEKKNAITIPPHSLDIAFLVNVLVQSENKNAILENISKLLKEKGRLVVIDWNKKGLHFGPDEHRFIDFEEIKKWAKENKFALQEDFQAGEYHRGLILYNTEVKR
ncbi:MAG: methyltransferase domain-containing protein [Candidatus Magasanikbacteria bacterium]